MPAYGSFILVAVLAFVAPVLRAWAPWLLVPGMVLELVMGTVVGPHGLGWAHVDVPGARVLRRRPGAAALPRRSGDRSRPGPGRRGPPGAGRLRPLLRTRLAVGEAASAAGLSESPLLIAVIVVATSLSVIIVPLKDAGETATEFGQAEAQRYFR